MKQVKKLKFLSISEFQDFKFYCCPNFQIYAINVVLLKFAQCCCICSLMRFVFEIFVLRFVISCFVLSSTSFSVFSFSLSAYFLFSRTNNVTTRPGCQTSLSRQAQFFILGPGWTKGHGQRTMPPIHYQCFGCMQRGSVLSSGANLTGIIFWMSLDIIYNAYH